MNKIHAIIFSVLCIIAGTQSAVAIPAPANQPITLNTTTGYEIGMQVSDYRYQEHVVANPAFMRETGPAAGLTLKVIEATNSYFLAGDLRLAYGENQYSSAGSGRQSGLKDYIGEAKLLIGEDIILFGNLNLAPYVGLGYRNLYNDWSGPSSTGGLGYSRDSQYFYIPVGITPRFRISDSARISINLEYDQLIQGWQKTNLSDANPAEPNITNRQTQGYGLHDSVMYERGSWSIGPFFNYWNINKSENKVFFVGTTQHVDYEPHNTTIEYGLQAALRF